MSKTSSLILIILSVAIFYTFTSPQYGQAQALAAQASQYQNVIDNVSRISSTRDNLLSSYQSIPAAEKDRLAKVLPDSVDTVTIARDLDTIASQYGISIKSVQVMDETSANTGSSAIVLPDYAMPYGKAFVTFTFISDYPNFVRFLADVERSLRIMDVTEASFRVGDSGLYEHRVTVETYWLK